MDQQLKELKDSAASASFSSSQRHPGAYPTPPSSTTPDSFPERLSQAQQLHRHLLAEAQEKIALAQAASQLVIFYLYKNTVVNIVITNDCRLADTSQC